MHRITPILLALILLTIPASGALVVADYEFVSSSPASTASYPDATANTFTNGSGLSIIFSDGWVSTGASSTTNSDAGAVSGDDYFTFTLTPINGASLNLTSLNFGTAFYANASNNYTAYLFVRSSVDNFATNIGSIISITGQSNTTSPSFAQQSLNLSGGIYQNLTTPITFRFYVYDTVSDGSRRIGLNQVMLNAIPEPSTAGLFLLGAGWLLLRKRRTSNSGGF